ncbi:uncharacterized protein LOC133180087 [Saccostrea echinata]|uniref:uncharacterized protein LOC133180087 n=1 Tax=Saccostrea echinata TaxID=191078 RepID=UPI002A830978|nr:uncharacterized protein LOC133180087 [Saccostrea echinata]
MLLILVISAAVVLMVEGQGNSTQNRGITNSVANQSTQPIINNAEAIKLAETLADTANQLLSILKRGSAPAVLCPSGKVQAQCNPDPCAVWDCSNIAGIQCERSCDSCDPVFKTRGRDVTSICEMRRIPQPLHLMTAPVSPFDTFASEGLHPLERLLIRGTFPTK